VKNIILLEDIIKRYAAYRAEQAEQLLDVDGILDFDKSPIKENDKMM